MAMSGAASFDDVKIKSSDSALAAPAAAQAMVAAPSSLVSGAESSGTLTMSMVDAAAEIAVSSWINVLGSGDARLAALGDMHFTIADLPGDELGRAEGNVVTLDVDAAGSGWFFSVTGEADTRMDLVTVVTHEVGHVLGFDHADADKYAVMDGQLELGVRLLDAAGIHQDPDAPVSDATLHKLAATAVELGFDLDGGGKGASGVIDWQVKSASASDSSGWSTEYSPYVASKQAKEGGKNFTDYLVKGFDSLGKSLLGKEKK
jgi:hypothetical protein